MLLKLLREGMGRTIVFVDYVTRPKPVQCSPEDRAQVEKAAQSLSLYQFYACPFCIKTRRAIHRLNLPIPTRDAQNGQEHRAALEAGGGRIKVPCLRIDENGESNWIYESNEIITYLNQRFDPNSLAEELQQH